MANDVRVAAVIPAFREAQEIARVVTAVKAYLPMVLVVDDCSPDDTAAQAQLAGAMVLKHEINRGKGAAIKTAFQKLAEMGYTHGVTLDGDGQHDPAQIPLFLEALQEKEVSLVVGNRFSNPRGMPLARWMVNVSMSRLISMICGTAIPDSQCGFRAMVVANPAVLKAQSNHYDYETEVLILTARARGKIRSVPVRTIYRDEVSKIRPVRDAINFFKLLWRV